MMNWIKQIAYYRNIRNEIPNQELANTLAVNENKAGIQEIADYLFDKNKSVASDCLKVMYEIGYLKPELIADYVGMFLELLKSKNNRMVWGATIALATIAKLKPVEIYKQIDLLIETMQKGTLITEVWGIKTIAALATVNSKYKSRILPVLFDYLEKCRPIDFASRVEVLSQAIQSQEEKEIFNKIIEIKTSDLSEAQKKKLKAILKKL